LQKYKIYSIYGSNEQKKKENMRVFPYSSRF